MGTGNSESIVPFRFPKFSFSHCTSAFFAHFCGKESGFSIRGQNFLPRSGLRHWQRSASFLASIVQLNWRCRKALGRTAKTVLSALLVLQLLVLLAMAACPALHELIHQDADKPGHECAVTMFVHGKVG